MATSKKPTGIAAKSRKGLEELQNTLQDCLHVETVHFTAAGEHYFNVHELLEKGKGTGKFYGHQKLQPTVWKVVGERKMYRNQSVHTPNTLIVQDMTREEVLAYEYSGPEETKLVSTTGLTMEDLMKEITALKAGMAKKKGKEEPVEA